MKITTAIMFATAKNRYTFDIPNPAIIFPEKYCKTIPPSPMERAPKSDNAVVLTFSSVTSAIYRVVNTRYPPTEIPCNKKLHNKTLGLVVLL